MLVARSAGVTAGLGDSVDDGGSRSNVLDYLRGGVANDRSDSSLSLVDLGRILVEYRIRALVEVRADRDLDRNVARLAFEAALVVALDIFLADVDATLTIAIIRVEPACPGLEFVLVSES